jgi:phosphoesterase RecJ-like protein
MNYPLSKKILEEIKKAKKILINCHKSPDGDSVGSALALYEVLISFGKEARIICPHELPDKLKFLPGSEKVEKIDFTKFDFGPYDLFFLLDSSQPSVVTDNWEATLPKIKKIIIDHHKTNENFADINLVDAKVSSVSEILYLFFEDCKIPLTKNICQDLLTGILTDTGIFQFPNVQEHTFTIAQKLIRGGADRWEIIFNTYKSYPFDEIKLWGEILRNMEFDKEHNFVWSAIPNDIYRKNRGTREASGDAATLFAPLVKDTDFGIILVEKEKGVLSVNLRGRTDFDVSKIAVKLGGGGHPAASGAKVFEKDFDQAVLKVLEVARKVASENKN